MSFSPAQCRAARALLDWSQAKLAEESHVATKTIADFERGQRVPYDRTLADIQRALEDAGVEFTNGGQPGVRLRKLGTVQLADDELFRFYLAKGPCFVRGSFGGEQAPTLRAALEIAEGNGATSIEVLNQAVGQILIGPDQMRRLIDLLR